MAIKLEKAGKPKFKIVTDFATLPMFTHESAVAVGKKASLMAGCDVEIFIRSPLWETGDAVGLGEWLKLGYFCEGVYYPT